MSGKEITSNIATNDNWLNFFAKERKFVGKPPRNLFYETFEVEVKASDGYFEKSDKFTIHLDQMPLLLLI